MTEQVRQAIESIEENVDNAEVVRAWRNIDEGTVEERFEFWVRRKRKEGEE